MTAEELAPYLDHAQGYSASDPSSNDESYVVPALVRFGGSPEVDDQGNLLYQFPSLQASFPVTLHCFSKLHVSRVLQLVPSPSLTACMLHLLAPQPATCYQSCFAQMVCCLMLWPAV